MHLTLCLPGLLLPRQALHDTVYDFSAPAFSRLLGRGRLVRTSPATLHDWLAARWRLDDLPIAPLRLAGDAGDPTGHPWMCLDPVQLAVGRDGVRFAAKPVEIGAEEDAELRAAVAPLFAELGELLATAPGRWHLRLTEPLDLVTVAPIPGAAVDPSLPDGSDGARFRRLLAEAQMVLHAHPLNRRRDDAGRPTVNSLWPWGAGRLPTITAAPFDAVHADDAVLRGLAQAGGIAAERVPERFALLPGRHLVVLDDLDAPARALDALAWREALARIERDWLAPLAGAVAGGRCRLTLAAPGDEGGIELTVGRMDFWRFWRRPSPLTILAS